MPLDPKTRPFLDLIAHAPIDYSTITAQALRERGAQGRAIWAGETIDLPIVREIALLGAAGQLPARIYDVEDGPARPCLVYFHGGGFVTGDLDSHDNLCRGLARDGQMRVIAVDYRRAPEHPFPAPVEDAIAAVASVAREAVALGVDPGRLAVGGDSAGGNLAAVAARYFARSGEVTLRHQMLIYPVTEQGAPTPSRREFAQGYFLTQEDIDWFADQYLGKTFDPSDERISPLRVAPPPGLAPAHVITAEYDPLKDEGRMYAELLTSAGVPVVYADYPGQIHGFVSLKNFSSAADSAIRELATRCAEALSA